jgi:hypothetical protein
MGYQSSVSIIALLLEYTAQKKWLQVTDKIRQRNGHLSGVSIIALLMEHCSYKMVAGDGRDSPAHRPPAWGVNCSHGLHCKRTRGDG